MRKSVTMPVIPPAQHHVVDLPPVQRTDRLVPWLETQVEAYGRTVPMPDLVPAAIYAGLLDRVKRGDFDDGPRQDSPAAP